MHKRLDPHTICVLLLLAVTHWQPRHAPAQNADAQSAAGAAGGEPRLVLQLGHWGGVSTVTFSDDGRLILTGSEDKTVVLWDRQTASELRRFTGHQGSVWTADFSPDARFVLSDDGKEAILWEASTGRVVRRYRSPAALVKNTAFGGDAAFLVLERGWYPEPFVMEPNQPPLPPPVSRLSDGITGREFRKFAGSLSAYSDDCRYVVVNDRGEKFTRLIDLVSGRTIRRRLGPAGVDSIYGFSPGGGFISVTTGDTVRVTDTRTGKFARQFTLASIKYAGPLERGITATAFSPDASLFALGNVDGVARLYDLKTRRLVWETKLKEEFNPVIRAIGFSPGGGLLTMVTQHDTTHLVSALNGFNFPLSIDPSHFGASSKHTAFSPDGSTVAVTNGRAVELWSLNLLAVITGREVNHLRGYAIPPWYVAGSPDGRFVLVGASNRNAAYLWDTSTGREVRRFGGELVRVCSVAFSPDGKYALIGEENPDEGGELARLFDLSTGQEVRRYEGVGASEAVYADSASTYQFSADGRLIFISDNMTNRVWDAATGKELLVGTWRLAVSPDSRFVLTGSRNYFSRMRNDVTPALWDVRSGEKVRLFKGHGGSVGPVAFSPDGSLVATGGDDKTARVWEAATGREVARLEHPGAVREVAFSPNGKLVATRIEGALYLWDVAAGSQLRRYSHEREHDGLYSHSLTFSPDGRRVLTLGSFETARLWDVDAGKELYRWGGTSGVRSATFSHDGHIVLTSSNDGTTRLWSTSDGSELCRLISFDDGTWVTMDARGHFDTNNLEQISGLHWLMPDDPLSPLPVEIFMRQYYEPRLLPRILNGERLEQARRLTELNRAQPEVVIRSVKTEPHEADKVAVTVEVARGFIKVPRDGRHTLMQTGVYDLRLFRDGQLVGYAPVGGGEINLDPSTGKAVLRFGNIKLPRRDGVKQIRLSAYAFNVDKVKSATAWQTFELPVPLTPAKGRAYLITVGINNYESPQVPRLLYAANDARLIGDTLSRELGRTGQYQEVVDVRLISDFEPRAGETVIPPTKANMKALFDILAGRSVAEEQSRDIPAELRRRLRATTPDDLVLISFSTHGVADGRGNFYLYPYDTGLSNTERELFERAVSNEDLSLWLRDVDAGELVMILDACHSGAAPGTDFKPGPMGSRGLGQLAYDKGMQILVATQADNIAFGSGESLNGLLVTALIRDGIQGRKAASGGKITMRGWLGYGVERVPDLYKEEIPEDQRRAQKVQQPLLFDFNKRQRDSLLTTIE